MTHLGEATEAAGALLAALVVGWHLKGLWLRFDVTRRLVPRCNHCGTRFGNGRCVRSRSVKGVCADCVAQARYERSIVHGSVKLQAAETNDVGWPEMDS